MGSDSVQTAGSSMYHNLQQPQKKVSFFSCIEATAIVSFMSRKRGVGKYGDRKWVQYL